MMNAVNIFLIMMSVTRDITYQNHGDSYLCNSYNDDDLSYQSYCNHVTFSQFIQWLTATLGETAEKTHRRKWEL